MVRKRRCFPVSYTYILFTLAIASLCAGLVVLQHFCMNHQDGDFIDSYCLTDSHMRAVVAAILTAIGLVLTSAVTSAVESYRSMKLADGINEGVYIAMASQSIKYRLYALATPWAAAVLLIILCTNAPNSIQTLANLGIKTAGVYVRNPSAASVYNAYSYYNATVTQTDFSNLISAVEMLTKMRDYKTSASSTLVNHGAGVVTSVLRDGYLGSVSIFHSDATNAFKRLETVATITSMCTAAPFNGTLAEVVPASPAAVNVTFVLPAENFYAVLIYNVQYAISSSNTLLIRSTFSDPSCNSDDCTSLGPETSVNGSTSTCISSLVIQDQDIVFTVGADSVTLVQLHSNDTTVSITDLADLIVGYADSIETTPDAVSNPQYASAVFGIYSTFPAGFFNETYSNILHTKLCASTSLALSFLWTSYEVNASSAASGLTGLVGNAFINFDAFVPLYNIVQITRISTTDVVIIAGVITGAACLVCLLATVFALTSRINVKPATDSSLLYNADPALIARKQALMSELSNDPRGQLALEFRSESVLYCRELAVAFPNSADPSKHDTYCRVNISHSDLGPLPDRSRHYC